MQPLKQALQNLVQISSKPEAQKFTHEQVGYEDQSTHAGQTCANCQNFIPAAGGKPAGCKGVKRPIAPEAWCRRFEHIQPNERPSYTLAREARKAGVA
jgi:hypothetical protein